MNHVICPTEYQSCSVLEWSKPVPSLNGPILRSPLGLQTFKSVNQMAFEYDREVITAFFSLTKEDRFEKMKTFSKRWKEENRHQKGLYEDKIETGTQIKVGRQDGKRNLD